MADHDTTRTKRGRDNAKIIVAGDLYAGGRVGERLANAEQHVWSDLYEELLSHRIRIVNLEYPLTNESEGILKDGPLLDGPPAAAEGIMRGGFNVVSLANNHIMDRGPKGLRDTLDACNGAGLRTVGSGMSIQEATEPLLVEQDGFRIAVLAVAGNEFGNATKNVGGAWPLDPARNGGQIRDAAERSDFVLVLYHGGAEYFSLPNPHMRDTCRYFVYEGADAVVCHHTHVSSGIEWVDGVPIAYSTGNFAFDLPQPRPNGWNRGHLVSLTVHRHSVEDLRIVPYERCVDEPVVNRLNRIEDERYRAEILSLSDAISDAGLLVSEWCKHCSKKRNQTLSKLLWFNRLERLLIARGIWPFWRGGKTRKAQKLAQLLNMIRCESHRTALLEILQSEIDDAKS